MKIEREDIYSYFLNNSEKLLDKWAHYFDIYTRHFARYRNKKIVMLEIGIGEGGSLSMWKHYFGEECQIVGLDINPDCKKHQAPDIDIFIGSQDDPKIVNAIIKKYPRIDVVLDDGSHRMSHMVSTFKLLFDHVDINGVYMIEDMHTCYWGEFEGGLNKEGSFMEFVKTKLDDINAVHTRGAVPVSDFTRTTNSITCYDSIVVFEKRRQATRQSIVTRPML